MNIYTHYSDSHKELYEDYFKASLRRLYDKDKVTIRAAHHRQTTSKGMFMETGWHESMRYKLQVILAAIEENKDGYFIFSDVDIVFYKKFIEDLLEKVADYDIALQEDCGSLCAGFFIAKGNQKNKKLFETIYNNFSDLVNKWGQSGSADQVALNYYSHMINYTLLDTKEYYTIGNFFDNDDGTHIWDGVSNIIPPKEMKVYHANYVLGVSDKVKLINLINKNYEKL
jgi:hypothetical protein